MKVSTLFVSSLIFLGATLFVISRSPRLSGQTDTTRTFLSILDGIDTSYGYTINEYTSYASSGGGTSYSTTRTIQSSELTSLVEQLKTLRPIGSFESGDRTCYFTNSQRGYLVCFAGGRIVNLLTVYGPERNSWSAEGYVFDFKRSMIMNSIGDLKVCSKDSDCDLTSNGVCDPSGRCPKISVDCDPGCRTSINVKYNFVWDFIDYLPDSCITDKCVSIGKEYFVASCKDGTCESVIVPVG